MAEDIVAAVIGLALLIYLLYALFRPAAYAIHAGAILHRRTLQTSASSAEALARDNRARTALLSAVSHDGRDRSRRPRRDRPAATGPRDPRPRAARHRRGRGAAPYSSGQ